VNEIRELNHLYRRIRGKPMTKSQRKLLEELRARVKSGEITVAEGHKIWDKKVLGR